jgi:hypothetical protein
VLSCSQDLVNTLIAQLISLELQRSELGADVGQNLLNVFRSFSIDSTVLQRQFVQNVVGPESKGEMLEPLSQNEVVVQFKVFDLAQRGS